MDAGSASIGGAKGQGTEEQGAEVSGDLWQALAEVVFPAFRQCVDLECALHAGYIFVAILFCGVQARDLGDGDAVWILTGGFHLITFADFSFAGDGEVEAGAAAEEEPLDHVVRFESYAQLVTRESRLAHDQFA